MLNLYIIWLLILNLLHAWMHSVCYTPKLLHAKLCLFVFVATLLHIIDTLLAYVADLFVASVCRLLRVRGQGVKRQISRSEVRIRYVEKLYLFEPYF